MKFTNAPQTSGKRLARRRLANGNEGWTKGGQRGWAIPWLTMWPLPPWCPPLSMSFPHQVQWRCSQQGHCSVRSACSGPSPVPGMAGRTQNSEVWGSEPSWGTRPTIHRECLGLTCLSGNTVPSLAGVVPSILL